MGRTPHISRCLNQPRGAGRCGARVAALAALAALPASPALAAGDITGSVSNEFGHALTLVWVDAYDPATNWIASGLTDLAGRYAVTNLPHGTYYVRTFVLEGWYLDEWFNDIPVTNSDIPAAAASVTVTGGVTRNINFLLAEGGAISGRVTNAGGTPLADVWVDACTAEGHRQKSGLSDTNGTYEIPGVPEGFFFVHTDVLGQNYVDEWYDNVPAAGSDIPPGAVSVGVSPGIVTGPVDFSLAAGARIEGRVSDTAERPLSNIWVDLYSEAEEWLATDRTASNGTYRLQRLSAGTYFARTYAGAANYADEWYDDVPVFGPGIPGAAEALTPTAGTTLSNVNFALQTGGSIAGMVTNASGSPIPGAGVHVYGAPAVWVDSTEAGPAGDYVLARLPTGTFFVRTWAAASNYVDEWFDDVTASGTELPAAATPIAVGPGTNAAGINFGLRTGGIIAGRVADTNGLAIEAVRVAVYDAATNWLGTAAAGADGAYAASGLPAPGPFFLATDANPLNYADVWYPDAPVLGPIIPDDAQAVSAPAGTITSNINMSLSEGGAVSGRVTDAALEPLPGVWVGTYDAGPQRVAATQAAADGTYTQNGLPAGSYFVRTEVDDSRYVDEWYDDVPAIGLGIPAAAASLTAWPGSLRAGVTFALSTGGAITGAVSDTHGAALPAVGVDAYDAHTNWVSGTTTAGDGGYSLSGLPTQTLYLVRTYTTANYVDEWFDDVPAPPAGIPFGAAPLALSTAHTAAAGFMLADGARLDGAVCDEAGSPLLDVGIELRATNSAWTALDATDGLGLYRFDKLPGGAYYLRTLWPELGFDNEWYDDIPVRGTNVPFEAAAVFVPAGGEGRADFALGFYVLQSGIPAGGRFQMQWQAASGTTYQVVRSANLLVWTNAPDGTNAWEQSRQRASAQELLRYEGPSGTNSTQYYRIVSFL